MKTAIYLRVSTDGQNDESQRMEIRQVCKLRGWSDVVEYSDVISGAKSSRAGLDRMMGDVRHGRIKRVVCYKMDRLGRSLQHLVQLIAEMDHNRVALVCPGQGIDTSDDNPAGRLQMHILMSISEFERSMIRERTMAGLAAANARGRFAGRPEVKKPDGWRERVLELKTVRGVAAGMGIAKGTAQKWLKAARES